MSDLRFFCPACQAKLAVDRSVAGYLVDCPECGKNIQIPNATDPALEEKEGAKVRGVELSAEEVAFLMSDASPTSDP